MKPLVPNGASASEAVPVFETRGGDIRNFESTLAAAPFLKAIRWRLAEAYWNRGEAESAARVLREALCWPDNLEMLEFAGDIFLQADRAAAVQVYEHILFVEPRNHGAHRTLSELYAELGQDQEALEHEKAATAIIQSPVPPRRPLTSAKKKRKAAGGNPRREALMVAVAIHAMALLLLALWIIGGGGGKGPAELAVSLSDAVEKGERVLRSSKIDSIQQKPEQQFVVKPSTEVIAPRVVEPIKLAAVESSDFETDTDEKFGSASIFSDGGGGGRGGGAGAFEFFGRKETASRVVFVVDCSGSMKDERLLKVKQELYKAVAGLTARTQFNIIYYANDPWVGDIVSNIAEPENRLLARVGWRNATVDTKRLTRMEIAQVQAGGGTYWGPPMRLALSMNPRPDLIWLLSDGDAVDRENVMDQIQASPKNRRIRINTIGLELGGEPFDSLVEIARETGGSYSLIKGSQHLQSEAALRYASPKRRQP